MKTNITLVLFFIVLSITAEVRYVSKTGSSTAPYTSWQTACDSLQKCFDYCNNGDTVFVDRGIYRETIFLDNKVLTIIGVDTDECIIDASGIFGSPYIRFLFSQKGGEVKLKNITLKRKMGYLDPPHILYDNLDGILEIQNCMFDSAGTGLLLRGDSKVDKCIFRNVSGAVSTSNNRYFSITNSLISIKRWEYAFPAIINSDLTGSFLINNNIVWENGSDGYYGIKLNTSEGISIKNNLIYRFKTGILANAAGDFPSPIEIVNNSIIYLNNSASTGILTGDITGPIVIKNNIIKGFTTGVEFQHLRTYTDYNLFNNVTRLTNMPPIGEHNIVADPMFNKDTTFSFDAIDNFRLQKFSPAIDTGDPSILDVDGTRSDIGMFGGPGGISYEYQDFAPKVVKQLKAVYEPDTNRVKLTWKPNTEADLKQYYVYKDINPSFPLDSTKRIAILSDTLFYDKLEKGTQKVYYKVTATDIAGNQSYPSAEVNVTITDINEVTITANYEYALYQNYPNPFNPTTTISYSLKDESEVRIKIYDITGKLIQTIIVGNKSKGYNETQIDLSNMASGIYLYRLEVTGKGKIPVFNDLKKMVLVK